MKVDGKLVKEGKGRYRWDDGSEYNGEWKNDKIDG